MNHLVHNLIDFCNPLLIFFVDTTCTIISQKSIFPNADYLKTEKIHIRLLVVHDDDQTMDVTLLHSLIAPQFYTFEILPASFTEMTNKLNAHNLLYCWIYKEGILQFERDNAFELLPIINFLRKDCATQVARWFQNYPNLHEGNDEILIIKEIENENTYTSMPNNEIFSLQNSRISIFVNQSSA